MSTPRSSSHSLLTDDSSTLRDSDIVDDDAEDLKNPLLKSEFKVVWPKKTCTYLNLGLCTLINLLIYLSARSLAKSSVPRHSFQDVGNLRRANPFIGLERADAWILGTLPVSARNSTVFPPDLLSIVNASNPHQAYGDQYSKWISYHRGWMPPHDRNFMVSDTVKNEHGTQVNSILTAVLNSRFQPLQSSEPTITEWSDASYVCVCRHFLSTLLCRLILLAQTKQNLVSRSTCWIQNLNSTPKHCLIQTVHQESRR